MSALTSLLVRDQKVPVRKIEEAIQRQVIAGGGFDTILLEAKLLPENEIASYCAAVHGLGPATRAECMDVPRDVVRTVPTEVAERHRLVPLDFDGQRLVVAVDQPLPYEVDQQLGFLLGVTVEQRIAPEMRIAAALQQHFGIEMVPRMRRLAEKQVSIPAGVAVFVEPLVPSGDATAWPGQQASEVPTKRFGSVEGSRSSSTEVGIGPSVTTSRTVSLGENAPPHVVASQPAASAANATPQSDAPTPDASTADTSTGASISDAPSDPTPDDVPASAPDGPTSINAPPVSSPPEVAARLKHLSLPPQPSRISVPQSESLRKHRGPLTAGRAVELLKSSSERDEILEISFAFFRQFFDVSAIFVVQEGEAEGLEITGPGTDLSRFERLGVPLDEPSAFQLATDGGVPIVDRLERTELDQKVRSAMARDELTPVLLLPIKIRNRVVLVFYGDRSGEHFSLADVPEPVAFAPRVSEALQQLILRRKLRRGSVTNDASAGARDSGAAEVRIADGRSGAPLSDPPLTDPLTDPLSDHPVLRSALTDPLTASSLTDSLTDLSLTDPLLTDSPSPSNDAPVPAIEPDSLFPEDAMVPGSASGVGDAFVPEGPADDFVPAEEAPVLADDESHVRWSEPPPPPRPRKRRERSPSLDVLGVPRSAPPPPMPGSQPQVTAPSGPPVPTELESDFPELSVDEDEAPSRRVGAYVMKGGTTEVVRRSAHPRPEETAASSMETPSDGGHWRDSLDLPSPVVITPDQDDDPGERDKRISAAPIPLTSTLRRPSKRRDSDPGEEIIITDSMDPVSSELDAESPSPSTASARKRLESSPGTPSVIIEMGDSIEAVVEDLRFSGPDEPEAAVRAVVQQGEAALPVLVREFPGPLFFDRTQPHRRLPRGRDISAVGRAIAAFGDLAVPYVISLLNQDDADHRFYAVLLSSEFSHARLVQPLGDRIFDEDRGVATLALDVLRTLLPFERELAALTERLRAEARIPSASLEYRAMALRALGELRDRGALDMLALFMEKETAELSEAAYRSLVQITRQDFGDSVPRWLLWIDNNQDRHRIEWLIDALAHTDEPMRRDAADELKELTHEYYGYHPSLTKKERETAQKKYRRWWETDGRVRFSRGS